MTKQAASKTSQHEQRAKTPRSQSVRPRRHARLHDDVMALQHAAGNRAVDGLLSAGAGVPPIVEDVVSSGGGQPLDPATRAEMEDRFGEDFSQVRIHTDNKAADSATSVAADAYTVGSDLVFGAGEYAPHSSGGRRLLAHELAHVVQQSSVVEAASSNALSVGAANSPAETAADHASDAVSHPTNGHSEYSGQLAAQATVSGPQVQRQANQQKRSSDQSREADRTLTITNFENDYRLVVFSRPISLEEAKRFIWKYPKDTSPITPDEKEADVEGKHTRFNVDVRDQFANRFTRQLTDSFTTLAMENLPKINVQKKLEEQGLPPEIAKIAPTLPYSQSDIGDEEFPWDEFFAQLKSDVFRRFILTGADKEVPWGEFIGQEIKLFLQYAQHPKKVTHHIVDNFHRFPGKWMVHGKEFPGDWMVRVRNGIIEAWQLKPGLDAYKKLYEDEDIAKRHHDASLKCENYVLKYWREGHPLDDAMGLMRTEVELDFKLTVWGAFSQVQGLAGVMSHRPSLERPAYSNAAINSATNRAIKNSQGRMTERSSAVSQEGGARPVEETQPGWLERKPIPVINKPLPPKEVPPKAARLSSETASDAKLAARPMVREKKISPPRRDTGKELQPSEPIGRTGTDDAEAAQPLPDRAAPDNVVQGPWSKPVSKAEVSPIVASGGSGKKAAQQTPVKQPAATSSAPLSEAKKPKTAVTQKTQKKPRQEKIRQTSEGEFYPDPRARGHASERDACDRLGLTQLASNTKSVDAYDPFVGSLKQVVDPKSGMAVNVLEGGHYYQMKSRETFRPDRIENLEPTIMKALEDFEAFPAEGVYSRVKGEVPLLVRNPKKKTLVWIFDEAHRMEPKQGGDATLREIMKWADGVARSKGIELNWYKRTMGGNLVPGS